MNEPRKLALKDLPKTIKNSPACHPIFTGSAPITSAAWGNSGAVENRERLPFDQQNEIGIDNPVPNSNIWNNEYEDYSQVKWQHEHYGTQEYKLEKDKSDRQINLMLSKPILIQKSTDQIVHNAREVVDSAVVESQFWVSALENLQLKPENQAYFSSGFNVMQKSITAQAAIIASRHELVETTGQRNRVWSMGLEDGRILDQLPHNFKTDLSVQLGLYSPEIQIIDTTDQETQTPQSNKTEEAQVQTNFVQFGRRSLSFQDVPLLRKDCCGLAEFCYHKIGSTPVKGKLPIQITPLKVPIYPIAAPSIECIEEDLLPKELQISEIVLMHRYKTQFPIPSNPPSTLVFPVHTQPGPVKGKARSRYIQIRSNEQVPVPTINSTLQDEVNLSRSIPIVPTTGALPNMNREVEAVSSTNSTFGSQRSNDSSGGSSGYAADDERSLNSSQGTSETEIGTP